MTGDPVLYAHGDGWCVVAASGPCRVVEAWSRTRLPFEPHGALREFKQTLAAAVRRLTAQDGDLLSARYVSHDESVCDTENVLLYNVGSFGKHTRTGIQFERGIGTPPSPPCPVPVMGHYHNYEMVTGVQLARTWRVGRELARFSSAEVAGRQINNPTSVWYAVKSGSAVVTSDPLRGDAKFGLRLRIEGPPSAPTQAASVVKCVIDGVVAAFQADQGTPVLAEAASRIGRMLNVESARMEALLRGSGGAPLGVTSLVHLRGQGVQWSPGDDRCVDAALMIDRSRSGTQLLFLRGYLYEALPIL